MKRYQVNRKDRYRFSVLFATLLHILIFSFLIFSFRYSTPLLLNAAAPPVIQATVLSSSMLATQDLGDEAKQKPPPKTEKVLMKPELIKQSPVALPVEPKKIIKPAPNTTSVVAKSSIKNSEPVQKKHSEKKVSAKRLIKQNSSDHLLATKSLPLAQKDIQKLLQQEVNTLTQKQQMAAHNAKTTAKYRQLILQSIAQQWIIPPEVNKKLETKLMVRLAPGGMVLEDIVIKSSGNAVLDRSAQTAVYKASPLPVPKKGLFNTFRQINLTLRPEGLLS